MAEHILDEHKKMTSILHTLDSVTRLSWSTPPTQPSFLCNGYHTTTNMLLAPRIVRQLQKAAIKATGRPRAIVFEVSGHGQATINIPKEVAESQLFLNELEGFACEAALYTITPKTVIAYPVH